MASSPPKGCTRRRFIQGVGASGLGLAAGALGVAPTEALSAPPDTATQAAMPHRSLGRSGIQVPILGLGGSMNLLDRQILLRQALAMGVSYWDTADNYSGGRSEEGIGAYFDRHPEDRKRVFLVTKVGGSAPDRMAAGLAASLERLKTDAVDLFFIHALSDPSRDLDPSARRWVDKAKADGKIRLFGFSTHRNMAACLAGAADAGWIDAVMTTYNFRLMDDDAMNRSLDACAEAGVGVVAMKTQGASFYSGGFGGGGAGLEPFLERGLSSHQAKLKAVWEDPRIASICSHMDSLAVLKENVAAATDPAGLTGTDRDALRRHAAATAGGYCKGCGGVCEALVAGEVPVADLMRCLMYAHGYNDHQMAREALARLPEGTRERILAADFSAAEASCPQKLVLSRLMAWIAGDLL